MKPRAFPLLALSLLSLSLAGCVIAIGPDDDGSHRSDVEKTEEHNRDVIARLELGMPISEVRQRLGEPDFSEALAREDKVLRVLRYRTHRAHGDGDTTVDETTALVFVNDQLAGIGETAWHELVHP